MRVALILFGLAALGGLSLAVLRLIAMPIPPIWMALAHGLIAVAALVALLLYAAQMGLPTIGKIALAAFVLAAVGGTYIFLEYHLNGVPLPLGLIFAHAAAASTGLYCLTVAFNRHRLQRPQR